MSVQPEGCLGHCLRAHSQPQVRISVCLSLPHSTFLSLNGSPPNALPCVSFLEEARLPYSLSVRRLFVCFVYFP